MGELGEHVARALAARHEQSQDIGAALLEEEDVLGLLVVDVAADDPQGALVGTRHDRAVVAVRRPAAGGRVLEEARDVLVEERIGLLA